MPAEPLTLSVNGREYIVSTPPDTPLLYVLRDELGLKGPKFGCGSEQCGACKVLVDGDAVPSCQLPVGQVQDLPIVTIEGLGSAEKLHPLQEAFLREQAAQCGYCTAGMIIAAQGLLNRTRYPTDDEIREALQDNLCRCGVYDRVRRAIHLRVGRPDAQPIFEVLRQPVSAPEPVIGGELPRSLQNTPDLDAWLHFEDDGESITVFTGKVELGQGIATALAQIVAEELDVNVARLRVVAGDTARTPDEGGTTGSMSLQTSGPALRLAAAEARHILLERAFEELEADSPAALVVEDGLIRDPASGRQTTYWKLVGGQRFGERITGRARPKSATEHAVVGRRAGRLKLADIVTGQPTFVHDMALPNMVHGRVLRPPGYHYRLLSVDVSAVLRMPGVLQVVRDGSFLGVTAEGEAQAVAARDALRETATWQREEELPAGESIFELLIQQPSRARPVIEGTALDEAVPDPHPPGEGGRTLSATYARPYHMHGALGPSAAVALMDGGKLTIWCHSQAVFMLQAAVAQVLGMDAGDVRVIHVEGAGCYGHNGADDAALDAALLARAVPGRPVLLQWMRDDEHAWEPYGPAMVIRLSGSVDDTGTITDWRHDVWSYPQVGRPRATGEDTAGFIAAWHLANPFARPQPRQILGSHFGAYRNADPLYTFPRQVVDHFVAGSPLRTSSLRALGAYANVFALESFMDELALGAGQDPLAFRLAHLDDERARAVLQAAAGKAGWQARRRPAGDGRGRGLAFARYKNRAGYAAVVVDVLVDLQSGAIHLERVVIAADAGEVVNPDGLSNQLEGGFVQAASWTLHEQVQFDAAGITSRDWDSYPVLRFPDAPRLQTVLLDRPGFPFLGSGEAAQGPTPAAIANAVFDATGARLRQIPFTPQRVRNAL